MIFKKRNAFFGRYPSCDLLNNALRFIFQDEELSKNELDAASEIIHAIHKADGYFPKDLEEKVKFIMQWANKNMKCKDCKYWEMEEELPGISEFMECTRVDKNDPDWWKKWHWRGPEDSCEYGERK